MIYFQCLKEDFRPVDSPQVIWLDKIKDYYLAKNYWKVYGHELPQEIWEEAHERFGYEYAGIIEDEIIVSLAAVWKFSEEAWEVAAVSTHPDYRKRGLSQ